MCINPIKVKNSPIMPVPCGRCTQCRARRISGWSFRLMEQEKLATSAHFITLTYDTDHVPITSKGYMSFPPGQKVRDLQLFFKRLRKHHRANKIMYYAVGEYGGKTNRPHYHIIIFGAHESTIEKSWNLGAVHYGTVSGASVGYTLKYISKPGKVPQHKNDDREREFSIMSKKLGLSYLTDKMVEWHKNDLQNRMYVNIGDGKKASMPRYFKDKIYTTEEREEIAAASFIREMEKLQNSNPIDATNRHNRAQKIQRELRLQKTPYKDSL